MYTYKKFLIIFIFIIGVLFTNNVSVFAADPTASFWASSVSIISGMTTTLSWSSSADAIVCTGGGLGFSTEGATSGSVVVTPPLSATAYTPIYVINCVNEINGSVRKTVSISVNPPPPLHPTFYASPNPTPYSGSTILTWSSTNANTCVASGDWSGTKTASGNQTINNLTSSQTYTISCYIADACATDDWGTEMYSNNSGIGTDLGEASQWCAGISTQASCNSASASPGGVDPLQSVCTWMPASTPLSTTVTVNVGPPPPANFKVTNVGACGTGMFDLTWDASPGATNYIIYRDGDPNPIYYNSFLKTAEAVTPGSTHNYSLYASNSAGTSQAATLSYTPCVATPTLTLSASSSSLYVVKGYSAGLFESGITATKTNVNMGVTFVTNVGSSGLTASFSKTNESTNVASGNISIGAGTATAAESPYTVTITANGFKPDGITPVTGSTTLNVYVMSGTLSASPCTITNGASACNSTVAWNTLNPQPQGTSAITSDTNNTGNSAPNTIIATGNSNTGLLVPVTYPNRKFYLYNHAFRLNQADAICTATCETGTSWDSVSGKCAPTTVTCGTGTSWDGTKCATTSGPPSSPGNFQAITGACGTGKINLSWDASSGATNYKIYRDGGSTPIYNGATAYSASSPFADTGLVAGSGHNYSFTASNSFGTSPLSSVPVTFYAPAACAAGVISGTLTPDSYSCIIPSGQSNCSVDLTWTTTFP